MEMTHEQFETTVDRLQAAARRVGLWPAGWTFTDAAAPRGRLWRRITIDNRRLVVYVTRRRRDRAAVVAEVRRLIVRLGGSDLSPDVRLTRAAAMRRLTERDPAC